MIQVFEGSDNMSLDNTHTRLTGHPMEIGLSEKILGRTFDGIGNPIDGLGPIVADTKANINGLPLNPVTREYPRNYIRTGISAIDGLTTLIRGQKLPIFSGNVFRTISLPHRSYSRLLWVTTPMKIRHRVRSDGCQTTMSLSSSVVPSRKAVYLTT